MIKFSENQSAPRVENRKTSPCSPRAPNLLHMLPSWMVGWNELCNPGVCTLFPHMLVVQRQAQVGPSVFLNMLEAFMLSASYFF